MARYDNKIVIFKIHSRSKNFALNDLDLKPNINHYLT